MATIKQLTKWIETSQKRISDFDRKITMYQERRDKNIAAANKKYGLDIKAEDIISTQRGCWIDYSLPEAIKEKIGYDTSYKIITSHEYMIANIKDRNREIANLERMKAELSDLEAKAKAEADSYNKGLEAALHSSMADFKTVWFNRMIEWHGKHYDFIKEKTPLMKVKKERIVSLQRYFGYGYRANEGHYSLARHLEKASNKCSEIISDRANRYDKAGYLAVIQKELESSWEAGIVKLTKKCQDFSVDESNVTACNPWMTSKGFEVVIKDGKPRLIYARVIWAAEYSLIVEPHIRYIVTERRV